MPDTQISEEMVDAFIATFNSGVFNKAPFGIPIDERCRCKKCLQEEADARSTVRAALEATLSGHVVGWREITEDNEPPRDVELLLGWWRTWPERKWEYASGLYGSTKGGWIHGNATHWQTLPAPPEMERG